MSKDLNTENINTDNEVGIKREEINDITKKIIVYTRNIEELRNKKIQLENKLYYICNHKFVYDNSACFDDKCKYICEKCLLYDNDYMYSN